MNRTNPSKPLVGVTGPDKGGFIAWFMTQLALQRAGAIPVRLTPARHHKYLSMDGFVIGGGSDIEPLHYGEKPQAKPARRWFNPSAPLLSIRDLLFSVAIFLLRMLFARYGRKTRYDRERDDMEKDIIQYALNQKLPVLGICRGMQLMNVACGGSLHQDITDFYSETPQIHSILPTKPVQIAGNSKLQQLLESESCIVNSLHNQSVKETGDDITVVAEEANGVIQAIEKNNHPFYIGVQWHPEYMPQSRQQWRLFHGLVKKALHCQKDPNC